MALIEYQSPERKEPRLTLRVFAGLAGAALVLLAVILLLVAMACCVQAITLDGPADSGEGFGLALAALVILGMALACGWISIQLIILALRNRGESSETNTPHTDSAESD